MSNFLCHSPIILKEPLFFKHIQASFPNGDWDTCNQPYTWHLKEYRDCYFKKTENWAWQVNYNYIEKKQDIEVVIVSSDQIEVNEAEMDEMWSFVHDKSHQYWLWWAIDHNTGTPLTYCLGTREHKYLDELCTLLVPFKINIVYADNNYAYKKHITQSKVITGKKNTQRIERKHLLLRTWCSRLVRKGYSSAEGTIPLQ